MRAFALHLTMMWEGGTTPEFLRGLLTGRLFINARNGSVSPFPCELSVRLAHKLECADQRLGGCARRAPISKLPLSSFTREQDRQDGDRGGVEKKGR